MSIFRRTGMVNVRMVITEEKILSNIDKIQKMINPGSKKQIVQLDEDEYFKDLVESIKTYLIEYPKKKNFPKSVYDAAYGLVEHATSQFEENTKQIEELIRQREVNVSTANKIKKCLNVVTTKQKGWKEIIKKETDNLPEDIAETLSLIGRCRAKTSDNYQDALKIVNARIGNLESNLHVEIDMERIEDKSKALSYIGIEIAEALRAIPAPVEETAVAVAKPKTKTTKVQKAEKINNEEMVAKATKTTKATRTPKAEVADAPEIAAIVEDNPAEEDTYIQETTIEVKPSLWQRIKRSKLGRAINFILRARIVIEVPALPEGRGENAK